MDTIIASLISGIIGMFIAIFSVRPTLNKIADNLEQHGKNMTGEHGGLSKEHNEIKSHVTHSQEALSAPLVGISKEVNHLYEEQLKAEGRQNALAEQQVDIRQTMDNVKALGLKVENLSTEIQFYRRENEQIKAENQALRQENEQLKIKSKTVSKTRHHDYEEDLGL